ncbi:MAG: glycosyltransferase WbuB [Chloroflexi bacterium]|nr:MAG: glycosyltransferase WbuB [Chloroflexota bacterium]
MTISRLILLKQIGHYPKPPQGALVVDMNTVKDWAVQRTVWRHLFRYREAEGVVYHVDTVTKPLNFALLLRLFSYGGCSITDQFGHTQPVTLGYLLQLAFLWLKDLLRQRPLLAAVTQEVNELARQEAEPQRVTLHLEKRPVYLRTDLVFGLQSGGSVGHTAGVLNHLDHFGGRPLFLTTDCIPTVRSDIETFQIWPNRRFREFPDLQSLAFNEKFFTQARQKLQAIPVSFLYQRYSLNNYAGYKLARALRTPFVLEFNGPEVWVKRNWSTPLVHEALAEQIELTNLRGAHVVVVVSQVLKEDLVARGIDQDKILVNPNGVNPEQYSPTIDGDPVRARYGLEGKTIIGFIGTFGPWHGAEVLAEAFGRLLQERPAYREQVRLLMIGDGVRMPQVKDRLARYAVTDYALLTGLIPQTEGPAHLAACDILASPHVPNPDGTPFFGSPTKLFEYMAMGKGIVASDLEQIGQVLAHGRTAWLVQPGDTAALMAGLRQLVEDAALRQRLGEHARAEVVEKYTWRAHTERIIEALKARVNHAPA